MLSARRRTRTRRTCWSRAPLLASRRSCAASERGPGKIRFVTNVCGPPRCERAEAGERDRRHDEGRQRRAQRPRPSGRGAAGSDERRGSRRRIRGLIPLVLAGSSPDPRAARGSRGATARRRWSPAGWPGVRSQTIAQPSFGTTARTCQAVAPLASPSRDRARCSRRPSSARAGGRRREGPRSPGGVCTWWSPTGMW